MERTKRYPLEEILFLVISGVISGCEGWKSIRDFGLMKLDWLRGYLPYENGVPVDDTIARVMHRLDGKQFQSCFVGWIDTRFYIDSVLDTANNSPTAVRQHWGGIVYIGLWI